MVTHGSKIFPVIINPMSICHSAELGGAKSTFVHAVEIS